MRILLASISPIPYFYAHIANSTAWLNGRFILVYTMDKDRKLIHEQSIAAHFSFSSFTIFIIFFFLFALYPQRPFIIWLLCAEASHCIIATKPWLQVRYIKKNEKKISTRRSNAKRLFDGVFFSCSPGMSRIRKNKSLNVLFSLHRFFFFSSVRCFFSQFRVLFFTFILHFPHEQDVKSHKLVSGFVVLQRFCCCYCCCCAPQLHVLPYSSICQPQFDSNKILI